MKLKSIFTLSSLFIAGLVTAQTEKGSLTGKVVDETNGPAPYASVGIYMAKDSVLVRGSVTSLEGEYIFDNLAPGSYYVSAMMIGYGKSRSAVTEIKPGSRIFVAPIRLEKLPTQLKEVSIIITKSLVENQIDKIVLNVENSVLATGNSALELLQKAPGVTVDKDDKINLRGKSGVQVMIDGKPSYLSQDQLANLLRSTDANSIQSIEIITNPSARFDASGNSGIINIKMKKNQNFGTNGTLGFNGAYGRYHKLETNGSLNHRQKLFNFFSNYSYANRAYFNTLNLDRKVILPGETTYFSAHTYNKNAHYNHNYKAGIDFFLGTKNTLGFVASGNFFRGHNHESGPNNISSGGGLDSAIVADNRGISPYDFGSYNINYKSVPDTSGTELTANLDYSRSAGKEDNHYSSRYTLPDGSEYRPATFFRNYTPNTADIYSAKVDFVHPFNKKTKLETGIKTSYVKTDNNLIYDILNSGTYENDPTRSNKFKYVEVINAAYVSLNTELFKDFSVQAGLRAERTHSEGNSITTATVVRRSYIDLFPTLFVKQKISAGNVAGASYSRRIDRPDYGSLNPFVYYIDQYTFNKGNPYLNPQYTDSYEVNYTLKDSYTASINYSHTGGAMTQVLLTDPVSKAIYQTNANVATQNYIALNINAPLNFTKWWKTNNNATIFFNQFKSPNLGGGPFSSEKKAWQFNTNHTLTLGKNTTAEMSGNYTSAVVYGTLNLSSFYGIDMGVKQTFLDKKLNLKLGVNDVLDSRTKQKVFSNLANNTYLIRQDRDSRIVSLSVSWRIGNSNIKTVEKRSGSEEEQNRLNNK